MCFVCPKHPKRKIKKKTEQKLKCAFSHCDKQCVLSGANKITSLPQKANKQTNKETIKGSKKKKLLKA